MTIVSDYSTCRPCKHCKRDNHKWSLCPSSRPIYCEVVRVYPIRETAIDPESVQPMNPTSVSMDDVQDRLYSACIILLPIWSLSMSAFHLSFRFRSLRLVLWAKRLPTFWRLMPNNMSTPICLSLSRLHRFLLKICLNRRLLFQGRNAQRICI